MRYKKLFIAVFTALMLAAFVHWAFFDIQRIRGEKVIAESASPDGLYLVTAYRNNGGATTGYAVLCAVTDMETGRSRNLYWQYNETNACIQWRDTRTAVINSVALDVTRDSYDYRRGKE